MGELRTLFESLGHGDVVSYIQSGNIVFTPAHASGEATLAAALGEAIVDRFDVSTPVILRRHDELVRAVAANPFDHSDRDPAKLQVVFLDAAPSGADQDGLDPDRSPPDQFAIVGRELFWWLPNGAGRSRFTLDYFERHLGVTGTGRNRRTVEKLIDLSADR